MVQLRLEPHLPGTCDEHVGEGKLPILYADSCLWDLTRQRGVHYHVRSTVFFLRISAKVLRHFGRGKSAYYGEALILGRYLDACPELHQ